MRGKRNEKAQPSVPVERAGKHKIVVGGELVETLLLKRAVVDEPAGFVDDDEGKDSPVMV